MIFNYWRCLTISQKKWCNFFDGSWFYRGSLIGFPVERLRAVLLDGAAHTVDSSELAFKLAALYAFRQVSLCSVACIFTQCFLWTYACHLTIYLPELRIWLIGLGNKQCYAAAKPTILEPIMCVELKAPVEFQGSVTGDLNKWVSFFTPFSRRIS